jgi:hypothetical protein
MKNNKSYDLQLPVWPGFCDYLHFDGNEPMKSFALKPFWFRHHFSSNRGLTFKSRLMVSLLDSTVICVAKNGFDLKNEIDECQAKRLFIQTSAGKIVTLFHL